MLKPSTPKDGNAYLHKEKITRKTMCTPSSRFSVGAFTFEKEALAIFEQVQANKQRILKKGSDSVYYSKKTIKTLKIDANGKEIVENFESTAFGGFGPNGEKIGEISQQYTNTNAGLEKTSVQRVLGNKLRRIDVKKTFDYEITNDFFENIDADFEKEWKIKAKNIGAKKVMALDSKEDEIIGSGSYESNNVTLSIQDSLLEPIHCKFTFKNNSFYLSDLSQTQHTWVKISNSNLFVLSPLDSFKADSEIFRITHIDYSTPELTLCSEKTELKVNKSLKISTKSPADFIYPSLYNFSFEIVYSENCFALKVLEGSIFSRLLEEKKILPGTDLKIGDLEFETCYYNYGKFSSIGLRPTMEDTDVVIQNLNVSSYPVSYYAIFDGHGGSHCSHYLRSNLHKVIQQQLLQSSISQWPVLVQRAFEECDTNFHAEFPDHSFFMGSAAIVCLIFQDSVLVANLGDCRIVLSKRAQALQLSNDHKPDLPSEKKRIEENGGNVFVGRVNGKLSLSRAFGDFEFKVKGKEILTAVPEVEVFRIDKNADEFLVMGCDGLFEAFSNQEIVKFVRDRLKRMRVTEQDPQRAAKDLVTEAVCMRRTGDNVSTVIITLCAGISP